MYQSDAFDKSRFSCDKHKICETWFRITVPRIQDLLTRTYSARPWYSVFNKIRQAKHMIAYEMHLKIISFLKK